MSKDSLNFKVSGEWVTEFARDKFMEKGCIYDGVRFLQKCLIGFPEDLAKEVISGKKKLVGINELTIEDDDKTIEPYCWIKPSDIKKCECGWIAPNGDVFGCDRYTQTTEHSDIATELIYRGSVPDTESSDYSSVEKAGFIKFQPRLIAAHCTPSLITEAQRVKILEFMESHGIREIQVGYSLDEFVKRNTIRSYELMQFAIFVTH